MFAQLPPVVADKALAGRSTHTACAPIGDGQVIARACRPKFRLSLEFAIAPKRDRRACAIEKRDLTRGKHRENRAPASLLFLKQTCDHVNR